MKREEFVLAEELGIRYCGLPTSEVHDSPEEFDSQISDCCCATRDGNGDNPLWGYLQRPHPHLFPIIPSPSPFT